MTETLGIKLYSEQYGAGDPEEPHQPFDILLNGEEICQGEVPVRLVPQFQLAVAAKGLNVDGIVARKDELFRRLADNQQNRNSIERDFKALRAECPHPRGEKYQFTDAGGRTHNCLLCRDCGLDDRDDH